MVPGSRRVGVAWILTTFGLPHSLTSLATRVTHRAQRHARCRGRFSSCVGLSRGVSTGVLRVFLKVQIGVLAQLAGLVMHLDGQRVGIGGGRVLTGGL
jgi:hypothetical protein